MAKTIWKGSIRFGLVNIPVGLVPAETRDEIHFHLLDRRTLGPLHMKRVTESGREVAWDETVRGYELDDGRYVVVSDEDLERVNPEATQTVDITDFVDLAAISPLYFDRPYYLAPDRKSERSYVLLREALRRTGKVGIAQVVIRTKQYLAAVVAVDAVLALLLLRYAHELHASAELEVPAGKAGVTDKELDMAERLVLGMVSDWEPDRYKDTYRDDLLRTIEKRAKAGQLAEAPAAKREKKPAGAKVVDLMELLQRSVEQRSPGKRSAKPAKPTPARKAASRKTAPRKPAAKRTRRSA
ncbi:MAG TPA: Ku protein [Thermoanaerobaculia bacterium]